MQNKYYTDIKELPVARWNDIAKTGDLANLVKNGGVDKYASEVYQLIQDQIINTFGVADRYRRILQLMVKIELLKGEMALSGDRTYGLKIAKAEERLNEYKEFGEASDLFENVAAIEQSMGGMKLDYNRLSVFEYYNYCKLLSKQANG